MMIPCVSCQSMFRLDNIYIKECGSKVKCSKCHEIFMVFPPDPNSESCSKNNASDSDVAAVIPNLRHSVLDDLFNGKRKPIEMAASTGISEEANNSSNESIEPIGDFEEVEEDENNEYAELPDLSEIEIIVNSILDERDHINTISPDILSKYCLTQDSNFSGA